MQYIKPLAKLIEQLRVLPGIGPKTATRLAYHILDMDMDKVQALVHAIVDAKEQIGFCNTCFNLSDTNPCSICSSAHRQADVICVVEQPRDVAALERMHEYNGVYHVLHGVLSPLAGVGPDDIKIRELLLRIQQNPIKEIIMATNSTIEGEATAMYIANLLKPVGIKVTRIAHGLPMGGDLEYADEITLAKALANRQQI